MTGDDNAQNTQEDAYYIPPTAGPAAPASKKPEKKPDEDWKGLLSLVLGMIILIAGFQLFTIVMQLINTWIAEEYVPIFTAAFDIAIIAGGIWLIRNYLQKK
jgi:hypothetical protein